MCKIPNLSKRCYCYPIEPPPPETPVHQQKIQLPNTTPGSTATDGTGGFGILGATGSGSWGQASSGSITQVNYSTKPGPFAQTGRPLVSTAVSKGPRGLLVELFHLSDHY
ncbi:hypothetical protein KL925_003082 [Ogataea polymorpha]|nr:hypothetical protein KL907_002798 [Ogataea polymorpha]KAG7926797.1 hypothetical protein KL925_003082 [Ogataea polymorpha]